MNARAKLIRFWAMAQERPVAFFAYVGNEKQKVEMGPRTTWARVAQTLDAMDPERIDALNSNGNVIRSCKPDELGDGDDDDDGEGEAQPEAAAPLAVVDAETARLQLVIAAVNHAHDSAQEKVGLRNGEVFDRMIDLFDTIKTLVIDQSKVVTTQNSTIQKLQEEQVRQALERAAAGESGDGWLDKLIQPFIERLGDIDGGEAEPEAEPPAPNGKGPH